MDCGFNKRQTLVLGRGKNATIPVKLPGKLGFVPQPNLLTARILSPFTPLSTSLPTVGNPGLKSLSTGPGNLANLIA